MKNLHCNDIDGNILSIGDKVVMLDTADLEGKIPLRCEVLEVTNCLDAESNYISFNNEYSFFGHRVLKLNNLQKLKAMKHTFFIERKATIWIRETHFVEAETKEQAQQIMIENVENKDTENTFDQQEFLYDTITDMDITDNLGNPVVELYTEDMELIKEQ